MAELRHKVRDLRKSTGFGKKPGQQEAGDEQRKQKKSGAAAGGKKQRSRSGGRRSTQPEGPAAAQKSEKAGGSARFGGGERPAKVERTGRSEKTEKGEKGEKGDKNKLKIIPLGGLNEIGKNITAFEYGGSILLLDCGMSFPDSDMLGIDVVIPDFTYLEENAHKIKGLILTHGHEDHIGGIPFLLKKVNIPVYGTRLTLGLVESKLKEHGVRGKLKPISAGQKLKIAPFDIEAIRVTHSIADSLCYAIHTPVGLIFHTGDFKIDYTPVDGDPIDFQKLAAVGSSGVHLMLSDSTNAVRTGYTQSEKALESVLDNAFRTAPGRIIIATFASNVHRVQTIIDTAAKHKRKVTLSGRSMEKVMNLSMEMGYIRIPPNTLVPLEEIRSVPDAKLVIITTGSQGEPMSALTRMANHDHRSVQIKRGDRIILSSSPIPGNERLVSNVVDKLFEQGAEVIYSDVADIHVSGHAREEELKLMLRLIKPEYFMPVHGEYRHLHAHAQIAASLGIPKKNIFVLSNGQILETDGKRIGISKKTVEADAVLVDNLGVGEGINDIGAIVLRDRRQLSECGMITVVATLDADSNRVLAGPEILTRGFVYVRDNEDLIGELRDIAAEKLYAFERKKRTDRTVLNNALKDELKRFINTRTKRTPVIMSVFMEE
ncbi:MAG: ribonuclease J [Clostridiales Family XIII bacterium]|jgi:ribonuclease J|nr:ribonuclease J [Clostridiales Family XIII bacterium]